MQGPLLTSRESAALLAARRGGVTLLECTLDLGRTTATVEAGAQCWAWLMDSLWILSKMRKKEKPGVN